MAGPCPGCGRLRESVSPARWRDCPNVPDIRTPDIPQPMLNNLHPMMLVQHAPHARLRGWGCRRESVLAWPDARWLGFTHRIADLPKSVQHYAAYARMTGSSNQFWSGVAHEKITRSSPGLAQTEAQPGAGPELKPLTKLPPPTSWGCDSHVACSRRTPKPQYVMPCACMPWAVLLGPAWMVLGGKEA